MNRFLLTAVLLGSLIVHRVAADDQTTAAETNVRETQSTTQGWRRLLDGSLDGWEVFTGVPHKTTTVPGFPRSESEDCTTGTPVGLGDPLNIFQMKSIDGEPVLYVTGQGYAGISSLESFSNYHLQLQYKWGENKYPPRLDKKRDSGLLVHCTGEHGAFWNVWLRSLECQIQEGDSGDFIALAGVSTNATVKSTEGRMPQFTPNGIDVSAGSGTDYFGLKRSEDFEIKDQWNTIDVMTVGDEALFAVNGHVVMRLTGNKIGRQDRDQPLTEGRLQLQSEAAEITYRRIRIRPITSVPDGEVLSDKTR